MTKKHGWQRAANSEAMRHQFVHHRVAIVYWIQITRFFSLLLRPVHLNQSIYWPLSLEWESFCRYDRLHKINDKIITWQLIEPLLQWGVEQGGQCGLHADTALWLLDKRSDVFKLCNLLLASSSTQQSTFLQPFLLLEQNALLSRVRIIESCSKIYCHCHSSVTNNHYERLPHGVLVLLTESNNFLTKCPSNIRSSKRGYFDTMLLLGPLNLPFQRELAYFLVKKSPSLFIKSTA